MRLGYTRASTKNQRVGRQVRGLQGLCDKLYIERLSAATIKKRPVFKELLQILKTGDVLVIWDLDRAFRSAEDAIVQERLLRERGIRIEVVLKAIDTSTADGNKEFQSRAVNAEWERRKISERTIEGLQVARVIGSKLGRPPIMTRRKTRNAMKLLETGNTKIKDVAKRYGVEPWTITRAINRYRDAG